MSDVQIDEVRRVGEVCYKVAQINEDTVICHPRQGSTGRYALNTKSIPLQTFQTYEMIKLRKPKKVKLKTNENLLTTEHKVDWNQKIVDPYEIKLLKGENTKLKRQLLKHRSGEALIIRAVEEAFQEPIDLELPPRPPKSGKKDIEIAALHISDTQIGKLTDSYSIAVAEKRLIELIHKTCKITDIRRSAAAIDEIRVYLGGDIIEGEDIFPHQAHTIEQGVFDQACNAAPSILCKCILMLLGHFNKVRIICVPGNHGRNGPKSGRSHPIKTNWDNICYKITKLMLFGKEGKKYNDLNDRLDFEENEKWYAVDHVFDWGNLIVHGDQITGGFAGFPWYGTAKKAWGWIDSIPYPWDYLWFGHFHTYASATLNYRIFLANGTTESGNDYAQANLASGGYPCQRLAFFNAEHGLISSQRIYLAHNRLPSKLRAIEWLKDISS